MEKKPFKVIFSMNIHQVANPEMSPEDAHSYIFFSRESGEKISVYVGLHFIPSDRKRFYTHSANPFSDGQMTGIEEDARRFTEDLGAVLDEVDFSRMSDSEKDAWIGNLDIFSNKKKEIESRREPVPQATPAPTACAVLSRSEQVVQALPDRAVPATSSPVQAADLPSFSPPPVQIQPDSNIHTSPADAENHSAASASYQLQPQPSTQPTIVPSAIPQELHEQPRPHAVQPSGVKLTELVEGVQKEEKVPVQVGDVFEETVRAGAVTAPKAQFKKNIRSEGGLISREKEALARLLASF